MVDYIIIFTIDKDGRNRAIDPMIEINIEGIKFIIFLEFVPDSLYAHIKEYIR